MGDTTPRPPLLAASRPPDRAVRRLLKIWRDGSRPDVAEFLESEGPLEPGELMAVLRADQRKRWRMGDRVFAEDYFDRFPAVAADPDLALDLIYGEYLLREEAGEPVVAEEFCTRFPAHETLIRLQVAFHVTLGPDDVASTRVGNPDSSIGEELPDLPGYSVIGVLGSGGMGIVYDARQLALNRRVALKMVLRSAREDPSRLSRFYMEARTAASLHHPNIVEIYEIGEHEGRPYLSLERVEGPDLAHEIAGKGMAAQRAARLAEQLARAMDYAHSRGVIHRDLKPANILLDAAGVPKITDFGLAKFRDADAELTQTQTGTVIGSTCSMSPEQAAGRTREVGPASDVYSLGAVLYEMLTGVPPFRAESPLDAIQKIQNDEPVRPSKLQANLPRDLETICLKCLEKSPARRYATAGELADDLERFLNYVSVRARPISTPQRFWRWCRRKTPIAVAMGLAAAALAATVILSVNLAIYHYRSARRLGAAYTSVERALRDVQRGRRQVDQLAATLAYEHGQSLCERQDVGHGLLWLIRGLSGAVQAGDPDLERAFRLNVAAWSDRIHPMSARWDGPSDVLDVAYSPDGRLVATASQDGVVRFWDPSTGKVALPPIHHPGQVNAIAFSPDGRTLASCSSGKAAFLWDVPSGSPVVPAMSHPDEVWAVAFSPDGKSLVTGCWDKTVRLWDTATGTPLRTFVGHEGRVAAVAFSPDGKTIASGGFDKTARLWDTNGSPVCEPIVHDDWVWSISFSPDNRKLATACFDRTVRLWDRGTARALGRPLRHQHCVNAVAFSPDSSRVFAGCQDGTARLWDVASCRPIGSVLNHRHTISAVAFSPDGQTILTGGHDGSVVSWKVRSSPSVRTFHHAGFIRVVMFSPDGTAILSASQDHTARLWDADTGEPLGPPLMHDDIVESVAFSPDGRVVLTGSLDGKARLWDAATSRPLLAPLRHGEAVHAVAFSPDGRSVLTGGDSQTAQLWDARTGRPIGEPLEHEGSVRAVAYSPNGRMALTASWDHTARLWDAATGRPVGRPFVHRGRVLTAAFSPDGASVLTGADDMLARLWDTKSGELRLPPLRHDGPVSVALFGPDGRTLITGGWDRAARLWDAATGVPKAPPMRHDGLLRSLALSPGGQTVLTGSYDQTAQLWEKATSLPIGPAFRHTSQVWFVRFSPDGRRVISGGQENDASLWSVSAPTDEPLERLELWVQVTTGMALDVDGTLRVLSTAEWADRRDRFGPLDESDTNAVAGPKPFDRNIVITSQGVRHHDHDRDRSAP